MCKSFNDSSDLSELIKEAYGSSEQLAEVLVLGMEMLFYLEEDTFEIRDVQHVASAMRFIRDVLKGNDFNIPLKQSH
ncbi:MAG: hypothetical protein WBG90_13670 [Saonia sp.]